MDYLKKKKKKNKSKNMSFHLIPFPNILPVPMPEADLTANNIYKMNEWRKNEQTSISSLDLCLLDMSRYRYLETEVS